MPAITGSNRRDLLSYTLSYQTHRQTHHLPDICTLHGQFPYTSQLSKAHDSLITAVAIEHRRHVLVVWSGPS